MDSIAEELYQSELVVLQHEIPIDTVEYVVELCSSRGVKVILNPAPAHEVKPEILEKVTYLTPNEHEAAILYGEVPAEAAFALSEKLLITQGAGVSIAGKTAVFSVWPENQQLQIRPARMP